MASYEQTGELSGGVIRSIHMTRTAMWAICNALNAEAAHFDVLGADDRFSVATKAVFAAKSDNNRRLANQLLARFADARDNTPVNEAAA